MGQFLLAHALPRMCLRSDPLNGFGSERVQPSGIRGLSGKVLLGRVWRTGVGAVMECKKANKMWMEFTVDPSKLT